VCIQGKNVDQEKVKLMKELQERDVKVHADFSENGP
jgi:hypothetical protein